MVFSGNRILDAFRTRKRRRRKGLSTQNVDNDASRIVLPSVPTLARVSVVQPVSNQQQVTFPRMQIPRPTLVEPIHEITHGIIVHPSECDVSSRPIIPFFGKQEGTIVAPRPIEPEPFRIIYHGTHIAISTCDPIVYPDPPIQVYGQTIYPSRCTFMPIPDVYVQGAHVPGVSADSHPSVILSQDVYIGPIIDPTMCQIPSPIIPLPQQVYGGVVAPNPCDIYDRIRVPMPENIHGAPVPSIFRSPPPPPPDPIMGGVVDPNLCDIYDRIRIPIPDNMPGVPVPPDIGDDIPRERPQPPDDTPGTPVDPILPLPPIPPLEKPEPEGTYIPPTS